MISISVVMPTYNTPVAFLEEAVGSILSQTFSDFEFIIIDDGSTDDSRFYLENLQDERIRLIQNPENFGITKSLNIGFKAAKGKYIARMDSDDISLPTRFEKQFAFMERHSDVIACGTNAVIFGAFSQKSIKRITDMETFRIEALFTNPGPLHSSAFFNRDLLSRYQISYNENLVYAQDYGLWVEIAKYGKVCILDEVLLKRRIHTRQISAAHREEQLECDLITQRKLLQELLGDISEDELRLHYKYSSWYSGDVSMNEEMLQWYQRLIKANDRKGIYNKLRFRRYVYNTVIKRLVYKSFKPGMNNIAKTAMFFKYIPLPYSLRAAAGMNARAAARCLHIR